MNKDLVERYMKNKGKLEEVYKARHPESYLDIVKNVIGLIKGFEISDEHIHEIDDGDYQGTLVYIISSGGYQPSEYWYVKVWYGSCSGCDTLEAIKGWSDTPTDQNVKDYMSLSLHIVQGLKKMGDHCDI